MSELDYSKLCSNYICNHNDGCCMESCEFYNHDECPVVYVNCLLGEKDKTISDLESKLAQKDAEITRRLRLQDDEFLEERRQLEEQNERLVKERDGHYENYSICWKDNERLKQQLTEKEETINNLEQQCLICNKDQENERLKQQLAEKDKEIAFLKGFKDAITSTIDNQIKQLKGVK